MPLFNKAPDSLCFLRLSAIGDVCHAIAAIQAVQRHWPETKITWVTGKIEAQLISDLDGIEVIVFDKKAGLAGMKSVWKQLKDRKFDALVHMQLALRASLLSTGIKARYRVGFNRKRAKELQWLFTNKKINDTHSMHVLDSFFSFIEYLGVPKTAPQWSLPLTEEDKHFAQQYITDKENDKKSIVISPAASKDERNWLTERYAQFADYASEKGYQVILCGSPSEREMKLGKEIEQLTNTPIINLIGKTSLKQLMAVIHFSKMVLSPDSGPAHLATTQNIPVIGLYGHSNPKRTGPYLSLDHVVSVYEKHVELQHGKPVSELAWSTRVKGDHVMQDILLEEVVKAFEKVCNNISN